MSEAEIHLDRPGIVVVQIDGLGRETLSRALRRRYMPFLRRLLRRRGAAIVNLRAGIPATTPAAQAALMYGAEGVVPGFRWFEKDSGRLRVMKNLEDIASVHARLPEANGLFRGGAVYTAFFSGGAERAYFTPGQTTPGQVVGPVGLWQIPLFAFRHFAAIARILGLGFYEFWLEILDYAGALIRRRPRRGEGLFPFERVISNAVLREVAAAGVLSEIAAGTPCVFANFVGFDVMAHHRGPRSLSASLALTAIDRKLRAIWRAIERAIRQGRSYELYILSDHGQTSTVPFERRTGMTLREAILEGELAASVAEVGSAEHREVVHSAAVVSHLSQVSRLMPWPLRPLVEQAVRVMSARLERIGGAEAAAEAAGLLVLATGGLAHLYFLDCPERVDLARVEEIHPGLVAHLCGLPGVRAVVARRGTDTVVRGADGKLLIGDQLQLDGSDPLAGVEDREAVARDLAALTAHPWCGDLVVLAGKIGRRRLMRRGVIYANFLEELGGHGGAEPAEQNIFLICPGHRSGLFPENGRLPEVYAVLRRLRGLEQ